MLIKWQNIKEINIIKPEKLFKKFRDKVFLIDHLNTQFFIISFLLPKNSLLIYLIK